MAVPSNMKATPAASVTVAAGYTTDAASEFWQRVSGNVFIVYAGVPNHTCQNLLNSSNPDTAIALTLASYPRRVAAV